MPLMTLETSFCVARDKQVSVYSNGPLSSEHLECMIAMLTVQVEILSDAEQELKHQNDVYKSLITANTDPKESE